MSASSDLSLSIAKISGQQTAMKAIKGDLDGIVYKVAQMQASAATELAAATVQLQGTAGYRLVTTVDDASNAERTAGQTAVISLIKANSANSTNPAAAVYAEDGVTVITPAEDDAPRTTQVAAIEAWNVAALAARPTDRQWLLHDPSALLKEYMANVGLPAWADFRMWIMNTEISAMGL